MVPQNGQTILHRPSEDHPLSPLPRRLDNSLLRQHHLWLPLPPQCLPPNDILNITLQFLRYHRRSMLHTQLNRLRPRQSFRWQMDRHHNGQGSPESRKIRSRWQTRLQTRRPHARKRLVRSLLVPLRPHMVRLGRSKGNHLARPPTSKLLLRHRQHANILNVNNNANGIHAQESQRGRRVE